MGRNIEQGKRHMPIVPAHRTFFFFCILGVVIRWTPFIAPRDWTFYVLGKSELAYLFLVYG